MIASQAAEMVGQAQAASAQNKHNKAVSKANEAIIRENLRVNQQALGRKAIEEQQSVAARLEGIRRQARQAEGTALASAGASGVSGNSLAALADLYERSVLESTTNAERTLENSARQRALQQQNLVSQAQSGLVSNIPQKVQGPGFIDLAIAGLEIGSFAYNQNTKDNSD
jgi:hypothetical protein